MDQTGLYLLSLRLHTIEISTFLSKSPPNVELEKALKNPPQVGFAIASIISRRNPFPRVRQLPLAEKAPYFADYLAQRAIPLGSETHNGKKVATWSQGFGERERPSQKGTYFVYNSTAKNSPRLHSSVYSRDPPPSRETPTHHHSLCMCRRILRETADTLLLAQPDTSFPGLPSHPITSFPPPFIGSIALLGPRSLCIHGSWNRYSRDLDSNGPRRSPRASAQTRTVSDPRERSILAFDAGIPLSQQPTNATQRNARTRIKEVC
ncbi:uncharacterized protein BDZ83DRAFT_376375 [Colletotrichum acutatum]|uniref:Uncharacterized protein n=1 Tax=Glomerella acutata TaxID=27357 RepID=A0AAD8XNH6_GLOAC|nr:uncharacterized protein BDZ83DRAFT_376375 [Colletotrichum acutatum]KAK1730606.1 hypothetical protein BDZ83DRAFT_376375 [Colletotrichum acutatum]